MRHSLSLLSKGLILLVLVVGLAACDDGGGSSVISPPAPTPTPDSGN